MVDYRTDHELFISGHHGSSMWYCNVLFGDSANFIFCCHILYVMLQGIDASTCPYPSANLVEKIVLSH